MLYRRLACTRDKGRQRQRQRQSEEKKKRQQMKQNCKQRQYWQKKTAIAK